MLHHTQYAPPLVPHLIGRVGLAEDCTVSRIFALPAVLVVKLFFPLRILHFLQWLKGSAEATVTKFIAGGNQTLNSTGPGVFTAAKCGAISPLSALSYTQPFTLVDIPVPL